MTTTMLTMSDRIALYGRTFARFPDSHFRDGKVKTAVWFLGNDYRTKSKLYGAYPAGYLPRIMAMFPDKKTILHVFSGSVTPGAAVRARGDDQIVSETRLDIHTDRNPDIVGDAQKLSEYFERGWFAQPDLILADPPYSEDDAVKYETPMPNRKKVIEECSKVLAPGGHLVWLDQVWPMHRKAEMRTVGMIGIVRSTNHRFRMATVFERVSE